MKKFFILFITFTLLAPTLQAKTITYSEHIAPILQKQCQACHRQGEVAPFALTDYREAKAWATEIAEYTKAKLMPPWKPAPGFGTFKNERRLTDKEIKMISDWAEAGAPEGDATKTPPNPKFHEGWALGEPDHIVEMPVEYEIEPEGEDEYRHFIIPTNFDTDMYVQAVDVQPGNRKTVHHVIAYLDIEGQGRELAAKDPKPGYVTGGTGPGIDVVGTLGGWAPGVTPSVLPEGIGYLLPKGADIVMQVHYYRTGHTERDQSRMGLYFSKTPKTVPLEIGSAINDKFMIPAGDAKYAVHASRSIKKDSYLLATMPHMHLLGRDMRIIAKPPTGDTIDLIWIQDWDFNWQDIYHYRKPIFLPAGTQVSLVAHFDNSATNPANPHDPPIPVGWGDKTTDEMCIGFIYYVDAAEYQPAE
ncbi:MAG: ascorbate-dependent monooxygenase [Candidatus Poribacteria bacterium]|nr:ascorbate-dependent monooxygenase [Candidatus Poribacteria bacterium]